MTKLDRIKMSEIRIQSPVKKNELKNLKIGDIVFVDGTIFTGREGLYKHIFDLGNKPSIDIRNKCNLTFHCSPAVSETSPGKYNIPAVTATASFRFDKYIPMLFEQYGVQVVIGKGGMQEYVYKETFRKYGAVYLTTIGYGLGAIYGMGIRRVKDVLWKEELGLAQAMWVLEVKNFGPFLVECDCYGNSLFLQANAEINKKLEKLYEGLPQPKLKRIGEISSPTEEVF